MPISVTDLPPNLTLMQVVAWIATRAPIIVLRASLNEIEWKQACAALGPDSSWCDFITPGLSLFNINLLCQAPDITSGVIRKLEHALQKGDPSASAERFSSSLGHVERRAYMTALDWAGLQIKESPHQNNELTLYRGCEVATIFDGTKLVEEWQNVRIELSAVDRVWPLIRRPKYRELKEEQFRENDLPKSIGAEEPDFLSAREALSLVAFGDPQVLSRKPSDYPGRWPACASLFNMWGFCIDDIKGDPQTIGSFVSRQSSMNMGEAVALRGSLNHAEREWKAKEATIRQADATLRNLAADMRIMVFGRKGKWRDRKFYELDHELIVHTFYFNRFRTINRWGWLTLSDDAPIHDRVQWRNADAPDWGDLRFPRERLVTELHLPALPSVRTTPPSPPAEPPRSGPLRRNRPGPSPVRTNAITAQMVADYAGRYEVLQSEKQSTLKVAYQGVGGSGEPSDDTVRRARDAALEQLRSISD